MGLRSVFPLKTQSSQIHSNLYPIKTCRHGQKHTHKLPKCVQNVNEQQHIKALCSSMKRQRIYIHACTHVHTHTQVFKVWLQNSDFFTSIDGSDAPLNTRLNSMKLTIFHHSLWKKKKVNFIRFKLLIFPSKTVTLGDTFLGTISKKYFLELKALKLSPQRAVHKKTRHERL